MVDSRERSDSPSTVYTCTACKENCPAIRTSVPLFGALEPKEQLPQCQGSLLASRQIPALLDGIFLVGGGGPRPFHLSP